MPAGYGRMVADPLIVGSAPPRSAHGAGERLLVRFTAFHDCCAIAPGMKPLSEGVCDPHVSVALSYPRTRQDDSTRRP